jgi:oligosaccharyltransferase complex subunit delta (ribophorin II)
MNLISFLYINVLSIFCKYVKNLKTYFLFPNIHIIYFLGHLINGVFKLSSILKRRPPLSSQQIVKLVNYFFSRRSVQTPKGVFNLLSSINTLASNEFDKPICIALLEDSTVISIKQPLVRVIVCDLLGNALPSVTNIVVNTAIKIENDVVVIRNKKFKSTPHDKYVYPLMTIYPIIY